MALSYASPGVYVEEVDRGTKPIEAVGTSTAAFVGITAEASLKAIDAATGERVVVEARLNKATLVTSWTQYTDIFGEFVSGAFLPDAVYGYFANGGGPCYVTSLRAINEAAGDVQAASAAIPGQRARQDGAGRDDHALREDALPLRRARCPARLNAQQAKEWREYINFDTSYAALYYPWIEVADLSGSGSTTKLVPPSGHIVGLYNRTDADRGVHKAPANDVLLGAINVEFQVISKGEQDVLNPIGVNCIRSFPARGIRVWGARTLSSNGSWRYINVRRLFILVEASMDAGLSWVVFEPNDATLWAKIRRDVTSFLRVVWRSGALFGNTPEEAFYVKCDAELNPPEIRDLGQCIIEVGIWPGQAGRVRHLPHQPVGWRERAAKFFCLCLSDCVRKNKGKE
jgi:uncharacterized protein